MTPSCILASSWVGLCRDLLTPLLPMLIDSSGSNTLDLNKAERQMTATPECHLSGETPVWPGSGGLRCDAVALLTVISPGKRREDVPLSVSAPSARQHRKCQCDTARGGCGNGWNGVRLTWLAHGWFDPSCLSKAPARVPNQTNGGAEAGGRVGRVGTWRKHTRPRLPFAWRSSIIETQSINHGEHYSGHLVLMDEAVGRCVCCHASRRTPEYIWMCSMQIATTPWPW